MDMRQHPSMGAIPIREHCALPTRQPPRDEPLTADSLLDMNQRTDHTESQFDSQTVATLFRRLSNLYSIY